MTDNAQNADEGGGFFITGVNTQDDMGGEPMPQPLVLEEEEDPVDKYRHVAVVDCSKAFSDKEVSNSTELTNFQCVIISDKNKSITYLNTANLQQFKFDCLVTSH